MNNKIDNFMSIKEIQNRLFDMLLQIDDVFKQNQIPYVLSFGTLLGAIRHKGFIPWDDDIDIHVPEEYFEEAMELIDLRCKPTLAVFYQGDDLLTWDIDARVRDSKTSIVESERSNFNGLYIDFFKIKKCSKYNRLNYTFIKMINNKLLTQISGTRYGYQLLLQTTKVLLVFAYKSIEKISKKKYLIISDRFLGGTYTEEDVYPLMPVEFCGLSLLAPKNHHNILEDLYGDYMSIPEVENQSTHFTHCYWKG
ncbi:LicD family protein [Evansella halocellulosilytica]|uniref:LicD family protein n=1 Tax=Evansella halocellulosilytica TaxID=2011013 RepID=UPI000BB88721|nr:LicD family protein [Evansella halocellulosilytica]